MIKHMSEHDKLEQKKYAIADALSRPNAMNGLYCKLKLPLEWEDLHNKDAFQISFAVNLADKIIDEASRDGKNFDDPKIKEELQAAFYGGRTGAIFSVAFNKYGLIVFGIITYILSVLSSATDIQGNNTAPTFIIALSVIVTIIFSITAAVRLWKTAKITAVLLLIFLILNLILSSIAIHWVSFFIFLWTMSLLWGMAKQQNLSAVCLEKK